MSYFVTPGPEAASGFWGDLLGGIKTAGKTALDIEVERARQQGASEAQIAAMQMQAGQSQTPAWLWPVVIGGGALAVVLLLKSGKKENPGRRRRRRW